MKYYATYGVYRDSDREQCREFSRGLADKWIGFLKGGKS